VGRFLLQPFEAKIDEKCQEVYLFQKFKQK